MNELQGNGTYCNHFFLNEASSEDPFSPIQNEIASLISFITSTNNFPILTYSVKELLEALLQETRLAPIEDQKIYEAVALQIFFISEDPHFYEEWWDYFAQIASIETQSHFPQLIDTEEEISFNNILLSFSSKYTQDGTELILDHQRRIYIPESMTQNKNIDYLATIQRTLDPTLSSEILHLISDKKFSKEERYLLEESMKELVQTYGMLPEELFSAWFLCIKKHMLPYSPFVIEHSIPLLDSVLPIGARYRLLLFIFTVNPSFLPSKNTSARSLITTLHLEKKIFRFIQDIDQFKAARKNPYYSLTIWKEVCTILIEELEEIPITYLRDIQSRFSCPEMGKTVLTLIDQIIPRSPPFTIKQPTDLLDIYLTAHQWHKETDSDLGWRMIAAVEDTLSPEMLDTLIYTLPKSLPITYSLFAILAVFSVSTTHFNQFFQQTLNEIHDCSTLTEHMEPLLLCFSKYKQIKNKQIQNKIIDLFDMLLKSDTLPFNQLARYFDALYVFLERSDPTQPLFLVAQLIEKWSRSEDDFIYSDWVNEATTLVLKKQIVSSWEKYTYILTCLIKNNHIELAEKTLEKIVPTLSKHLLPYVDDLIYLLFDYADENKKESLFLFYKRHLPTLSYPEFNLCHLDLGNQHHRELLFNSLHSLELSEEDWIYLFDITETLSKKQRTLLWKIFSTSLFFHQPTKLIGKKIYSGIKTKLLNPEIPNYTFFLSNLMEQFDPNDPWIIPLFLFHTNYYSLNLNIYKKLTFLISKTDNPNIIQNFFKATLNSLCAKRKIPTKNIKQLLLSAFHLVENKPLVLKLAFLIDSHKPFIKKLLTKTDDIPSSLERIQWYEAAIPIHDSLIFLLELNVWTLEASQRNALTYTQTGALMVLILQRISTLYPVNTINYSHIPHLLYIGHTNYNLLTAIGHDPSTEAVLIFYFDYGLKLSIEDPLHYPIGAHIQSVDSMLDQIMNPELHHKLSQRFSLEILQNYSDMT